MLLTCPPAALLQLEERPAYTSGSSIAHVAAVPGPELSLCEASCLLTCADSNPTAQVAAVPAPPPGLFEEKSLLVSEFARDERSAEAEAEAYPPLSSKMLERVRNSFVHIPIKAAKRERAAIRVLLYNRLQSFRSNEAVQTRE